MTAIRCVRSVGGKHRRMVRFTDGTATTYARLLGAITVGRPLRNIECAHHLNLDPTDDRLANIVVLDWGQHTELHKFLNGTSKGRWLSPDLVEATLAVTE